MAPLTRELSLSLDAARPCGIREHVGALHGDRRDGDGLAVLDDGLGGDGESHVLRRGARASMETLVIWREEGLMSTTLKERVSPDGRRWWRRSWRSALGGQGSR